MEDIAPALLEQLQGAFLENLKNDKTAAKLLEEIQAGTATYAKAGDYAEQVGTALADAFSAGLSSDVLPDGKLYWNLADRVVRPLLEQDYELVSDAAAQVQTALNEAAGIGIKAQTAALNTDRVDGLLNKICAADNYDDVAWALGEPVKTFSRSVVDDTVKANVEFQGESGLSPKVIRETYFGACQWCLDVAGTYTYPNVPKDVYRRHRNCRCSVEYDPGSGKRQNVWTKKWTKSEDSATLEARKTVGLDETRGVIQRRINQGQYNLNLPEQQYLKHVEGTVQYQQYAASRAAKGKSPQGRLTISRDEAQQLIKQYAGKGTPHIQKRIGTIGIVGNKEYGTANDVIGQYCNSKGEWISTKRFAIYYGKNGSHIVPVQEVYNG